jgi:hypothetical protein
MNALRQAIADAREDAAVLKRNGFEQLATTLDRHLDNIATAAEPFTKTLTLSEARLKSGASIRWLTHKARGEWADLGFAGVEHGQWRILDCIVPQRLHPSAIKQQAEADARAETHRARNAG